MTELKLAGGLSLTEFRPEDENHLLRYLNDRGIYENTLRIPYPYRSEHVQQWFELLSEDQGQIHQTWAIRKQNDGLIGGIGLHEIDDVSPHRREIGYWVARPFWGQGVASQAVRAVCEFGFSELGLIRIQAGVFVGNIASVRVLEKNRFQLEGTLRKCYFKDGRYIDAMLYARVL